MSKFLDPYMPGGEVPFFSSYILLLMKVALLALFMLIPVVLLKIWRSESSFLTILILFFLFVMALAIFGIFLGFFQLLYS